ncbi:hypothetical protein MPTK1_5g10880 [Marchantia polymorpha subsp. ruderalis]|nr:hypothetical protein MARPO_0093s0009 [Marchantia polymorpha]BBN11319.1 hypothetical protein Mp_5g10880 [Marchantia polymorpha subsp. ruderalis]|eukprot:PTQ32925.1 hypothetical protein MARPO_0093s0009 [Marchantia polymorpha]
MGRGNAGLSLLTIVLLGLYVASTTAQTTPALNITSILAKYPRFSVLSDLLVSSGVEKEINSRTSITLLAPADAVLTAFQASVPNADTVKIADLLRYHVLLQYFDMTELKGLGTVNYSSVTTLLQTTGRANEQDGFVNIYNTATQILIGPAASASASNATVVGTVLEDPYDISIIEIDQVLKPAGFDAVEGDLVTVLESFQTFSLFISYLKATGVDGVLATRQTSGGLTVFAPRDSAFNALKSGSIQTLSPGKQKLLMQYHALTQYYTMTNFLSMVDAPVQTVSSTVGGGYLMNITSKASTVTIKTGVGNATVGEVLYNANPVTMYAIDKVLLPTELFGTPDQLSPAEAPTPTPDAAPAPTPKASAPVPPAAETPTILLEPEVPPASTNPNAASVAGVSGALSAAVLIVSSIAAFL